MAKRTCTVDGCEKVHRARGLCQMHYKRAGYSPSTRYPVTCVECGVEYLSARKTGRFCSDACKGDNYRVLCPLPVEHPVRVLMAGARRRQVKPKPTPFSAARECAWCATTFITTRRTQAYCSHAHKVKALKNRRRGREHGSTSHYTWAEVMRLFIGSFGRCCAYCEQPIAGQPEPDHVVPLSRGGSNSITNILPSCSLCNADKRDLFLHEWAADRARLGKPERVTAWAMDDARFAHLTDALLVVTAA